ncbi:MAG: hypothetical protein OFPII_10860 [Osedax symbiont Rs1]|nr:MAG: hypothetical protein OFPII_10860 [Osedax symbiont Rs1]
MLLPRRQLRLISALLLLIAAVIAWNTSDNNTQKKPAPSASSKSDIDFFIKQAVFKSYTVNGALSKQLSAEQVEHFKQQQQSHLSAPVVSSFTLQLKTAQISSLTASVADHKGIIIFNRQVKVTSFKDNIANTFLNTQRLSYDRTANTISTDSQVEFSDTFGNITTATGLFSDVALKTINLKSNVKGIFNAQ